MSDERKGLIELGWFGELLDPIARAKALLHPSARAPSFTELTTLVAALVAEAERLRERQRTVEAQVVCERNEAWARIRALEAENAELREQREELDAALGRTLDREETGRRHVRALLLEYNASRSRLPASVCSRARGRSRDGWWRSDSCSPRRSTCSRAVGGAMSESGARPCRKCGMQIEMIVGPNGKVIPAQKIRTVYMLFEGVPALDKLLSAEVEADYGARLESFYVSHFETCPNASDFSKGKR